MSTHEPNEGATREAAEAGGDGELLFLPGRVVATPGAREVLEECGVAPAALLKRHLIGDWGEVPPEDAAENEAAIRENLRLLSSYPVGADRKVWIITEADRSSTCLLLPEEY